MASKRSCSSWWWILILPVLLAVILYYLTQNTPPDDFGTGSMFDLIATRYDFINRVLALKMDMSWRQQMVQVVQDHVKDIQEPKLLDLATGTADVALLLAHAIPTAHVLGLDPSHNMLNVGRTKVQQHNLVDSVDLQWADARDLKLLESASIDGATMAFGIRNVVPDRSQALCEIRRVLKPEAVFCILEFSEPQSRGVLSALARGFIRYVVPVVGGILSGAPREYLHLQNSIQNFPTPDEFANSLETLECNGDSGAFYLEELVQMNFGSVQLYVTTKKLEHDPSDQTHVDESQAE